MTEQDKFDHWLIDQKITNFNVSISPDFSPDDFESVDQAKEAMYKELNVIIDSFGRCTTVYEDY